MNEKQLAEAQAAWARIQEQGYRAVIRRIAGQIWFRMRGPTSEVSWKGCLTPAAEIWVWEEVDVDVSVVVDPKTVELSPSGKVTASLQSMTITKGRKQVCLTGRPVPMAMVCGAELLEKSETARTE